MTIIEYGPNRPHKAGFLGLRVFVKRVGDKPYQKYLSLRGLSERQIEASWMLARHLELKAMEDAALRRESSLLYKGSRCDLSPVHGISMCVANRIEAHGGYRSEFAINVCSAGISECKSGSIWRKTKAVSQIDYGWFKAAWDQACEELARARGYQSIPTAWLWSIPSKEAVYSFIRGRAKAGRIKEEAVSP